MSLPPGWQQHIDPTSGNPYFHCLATGQVTWDRPSGTDGPASNAAPDASQTGASNVSQDGAASNEVKSSGENASAAPATNIQQLDMTQMAPQGSSVADPANSASQQPGTTGPDSEAGALVPATSNQQSDMTNMAPQGATAVSNFGEQASNSSQQLALVQGGGDSANAAPTANSPQNSMVPQMMAQMTPQAAATPNGTMDAFTQFSMAAQSMMQQAMPGMPQQAFANGAMAGMNPQQAAMLMMMQQAQAAQAAQLQQSMLSMQASSPSGAGAAAAVAAAAGGEVRTGIVKSWNEEKGFGFVDPADGNDNIFVHRTQLLDGDMLTVGNKVQFELEFNAQKGKMQAKNVRGATGKGGGKGSGAAESPTGGASGTQPGTVKVWFEDRGFGFVTLASGEDCYIHRTNLKDGQTLLTGAELMVEVEWDAQRNKYKTLSATGAASSDVKGAGKGEGPGEMSGQAGAPAMPGLAGLTSMPGMAGLAGMAGMAGLAGMAGIPGMTGMAGAAGTGENRYNPY